MVDCEDVAEECLTYEDVMGSTEREEWSKAIEEEMKSFHDNDAWELVDKPSGVRIVQCKWVFKKKLNSDNSVRYRARLVAKGFSQKKGIDYKETFSPVLRYSTLKMLFAVSVNLDLNIVHLDVKTAFLNGELKETVYMQLPNNLRNKDNMLKVLRLKKAIYGLKQSARAWYKKVDNCLLQLGYRKSMYEPCLFVKITENVKTYIALFVDDFFIFSSCNKEIDYLKAQLSARFQLKDLGILKQCLGMDVTIEKGKICIHQKKFIEKLLCKFNMQYCNGVQTPMEVNLKLEKDENKNVTNLPYQQLIGSLMYISVLTRPDISFTVSFLSQYNNCYSEIHWKHAKRVLKYLYETKTYGLMYVKNNCDLIGFVDADWGSNMIDRRSFTGYCFLYSGCVISHECRKQQTVALSSTEAEYMAICEASKEAIFLKNLLSELIISNNNPIVLYNDSQSAQNLADNNMYHRRSKHIDIRFHFIREIVEKKIIKLNYLNTSQMPADLLTKSLGKEKHYSCLNKMGIVNLE
uniref:Reverse transcriptase Ty1/copia-type domain-containing protein n=1 Tax=Heliothis virescens TaxID=7102 RepID=A0A2A4J3A4_HELVI